MTTVRRAELFSPLPESVWMELPARFRVVAFLAQRNRGGPWHGRQADIADAIGLTQHTVQQALRAAEKRGWIVSAPTCDRNGYNGFNVYAVVGALPAGCTPAAAIEEHARQHRLNLRAHDESPGQQAPRESRGTAPHETRGTAPHETRGTAPHETRGTQEDPEEEDPEDQIPERGRNVASDVTALPLSDDAERASTLARRYEDALQDTALGDDAWKVAHLLAFLWFVGLDELRNDASVLDVVADPGNASFNQWVDALVDLYGGGQDLLGTAAHEHRCEFMRFVDPNRWDDERAVDMWMAAV